MKTSVERERVQPHTSSTHFLENICTNVHSIDKLPLLTFFWSLKCENQAVERFHIGKETVGLTELA
jgi:hypothetical protein